MSLIQSEYTRRLVPIWRASEQINGSAEYCSHRSIRRDPRNFALSKQKYENWQKNKSVGYAVDVLATAIAVGDYDTAKQIRAYLTSLGNKTPSLIKSAIERLTIAEQSNELQNLVELNANGFRKHFKVSAREQVSKARRKLKANPRNALTWLDMARAYAALGQKQKSITMSSRALQLEPNNRYVLRNVARQYLQYGDRDLAHRLILKNSESKYDPWMVAAEISFSIVTEKSPKFYRIANEMLTSGNYSDAHLSELRGAMGTLYYFEGAERKSRSNIRASLIAPNDNTVAQASWINAALGDISLPDEVLLLPSSHEARYSQYYKKGKWKDALSESVQWMIAEPYSPRAARFACNLCVSVVNDYELALRIADAGLQISPNNELLNLKTIAHAYIGELNYAIDTFRRINLNDSENFPEFVYLATAGLLQFRIGEDTRGRELYINAESKAPAKSKRLVRLFRAREELAHQHGKPNNFVENVIAENIDRDDLWALRIQTLLSRAAEDYSSKIELPDHINFSIAKNASVPLQLSALTKLVR